MMFAHLCVGQWGGEEEGRWDVGASELQDLL